MRLIRLSILTLLAALFAMPSAFAQYDTATVLGTVTDASASVVPGGNITLRNTATGVIATRTSNQSGEYEFTGVLPGDYTLATEATGFVKQTTTFSVPSCSWSSTHARVSPSIAL